MRAFATPGKLFNHLKTLFSYLSNGVKYPPCMAIMRIRNNNKFSVGQVVKWKVLISFSFFMSPTDVAHGQSQSPLAQHKCIAHFCQMPAHPLYFCHSSMQVLVLQVLAWGLSVCLFFKHNSSYLFPSTCPWVMLWANFIDCSSHFYEFQPYF